MPAHGKGGRPKKPDEVKKLQGTYRGDRSSNSQPAFTGTPLLPRWLDGRARLEWQRVAPQLRKLGMLTEADLAMFAAYCQAFGDYVDLTVRLGNMEATVMVTEKGYAMARPEVAQRRAAYQQMRECAREFGFTPASRTAIRLQIESEQEPDVPTDSQGRSITLMR